MKWNIIADSSCDLLRRENLADDTRFASIPFVITVDNVDYVDDEALDTTALLDAMDRCPTASHTSCPSPHIWQEEFMKAEQSIAITISGALSGSYNSAMVARNMVWETHPDQKIHIVDSRSTGPEPAMIAERINALIQEGLDFAEVVAAAEAYAAQTHVLFTLSSFENLVKNGRVSRMVGFIAGKLGLRVICYGTDEGKIVLKHKTLGIDKALTLLINEMSAMGYGGGRVTISQCHNMSLAETLRGMILRRWSAAYIRILATRGLCSYYAERNGLIVAF